MHNNIAPNQRCIPVSGANYQVKVTEVTEEWVSFVHLENNKPKELVFSREQFLSRYHPIQTT